MNYYTLYNILSLLSVSNINNYLDTDKEVFTNISKIIKDKMKKNYYENQQKIISLIKDI